MSRLYNILNQLVGSKETLATGATLIRSGKNRKLILNGYTKTSTNLTIPPADAPSKDTSAAGLRTDSNGRSTALGRVTVYASQTTVAMYYAGSYNASSSGLTSLASGDKIYAVLEWAI